MSKLSYLREMGLGKPTEVGVAKLYLIHYERNAWHSTWVSKFNDLAAVRTSFKAAREDAEAWRVQGSIIGIKEFPAFFVSDGVSANLVLDPNTSYWHRLSEILSWAPDLNHAIDAATKQLSRARNIMFAATNAEALEIAGKNNPLAPWHRHASENVGSNYCLNWHPKKYEPGAVGHRGTALKRARLLLEGMAP